MVLTKLFKGTSQSPAGNVQNEQQQSIPIRGNNEMDVDEKSDSPPSYSTQAVSLQLHHIASKEALIVKIQPPQAPSTETHHVPSDIVLVIDISGSMGTAAPVPGEDPSEDTGLSVLDLTKHAAFTIIETMDERDRLGIVTFGTKSRVVQALEPMTNDNKEKARKKVKALRPLDSTNLWHGILDGVKLFGKEEKSPRVPAIMVLTDGMPNHMCPSMGYIPKLRSVPPLPAPIYTFGFGYSLRSGLLKSIAEFSGGNYAFIPDAGMIGTVFVHAVANLQSTFATKATLNLTYTVPVEIEETLGDFVDKQVPVYTKDGQVQLTLPLGNIQYGQSRDIWLRIKNTAQGESSNTDKGSPNALVVDATLSFKEPENPTASLLQASLYRSMLDTPALSPAEVVYHESRALICNFLSSLFPLGQDGEHRARTNLQDIEEGKKRLDELIANLPGRLFPDDKNKSLMEDLNGEQPKGQISLAISSSEFFNKWGKHFLPSYLNAHTRQICNSFKDSGPLQYSADSPLFIACRNRLDDAFDNLPPPEPSRTTYAYAPSPHGQKGSSFPRLTSMSKYRNVSGVCFAGSTPVELASGKTVEIRKLRRGVKVRTPAGPRKVALVLKTQVVDETLCRVGSLLVTPWHPISADDKAWDFPANKADRAVRYTGSIYSILLQQDENSNAHAIRVAGTWGVTLGHGITKGVDVRAHEFFGDYMRVVRSLMKLPTAGKKGVIMGGGVKRDAKTGLVTGFRGTAKPVVAAGAPRQKVLAVSEMLT